MTDALITGLIFNPIKSTRKLKYDYRVTVLYDFADPASKELNARVAYLDFSSKKAADDDFDFLGSSIGYKAVSNASQSLALMAAIRSFSKELRARGY